MKIYEYVVKLPKIGEFLAEKHNWGWEQNYDAYQPIFGYRYDHSGRFIEITTSQLVYSEILSEIGGNAQEGFGTPQNVKELHNALQRGCKDDLGYNYDLEFTPLTVDNSEEFIEFLNKHNLELGYVLVRVHQNFDSELCA